MTNFETEYNEFMDRALALGLKARREGLLALEDEIDAEKESIRDVFEWGLRLAVNGTAPAVIDKILTNIINQETEPRPSPQGEGPPLDKDKITMGEIKKDAILAIQAGWRHDLIALLINSHVNIQVEETLRRFGMDGEDNYKNPSSKAVICKICGSAGTVYYGILEECAYCGNKIQFPEEETPPLTEQDIRFNKAFELYDAKQYAQAKPLIEALASEGYSPAQSILGNYYYYGRETNEGYGVEKDWEKANKWYSKAADQGDPRGLNNLGTSYMEGEGVEKDEAKGFGLFREAAKKGYPQAQNNLARCFYFGQAVDRDLERATFWYRRAAFRGNPAAQGSFGALYYAGERVEQDYEIAIEWFNKAADQGDEFSVYMLGECYFNGNGVTQDLGKAFEMYNKAAEMGHPWSQCAVGTFFFFGLGIKQDYAKAFESFQKAAQEVAEAQYYLGICYYFGLGIKEDRTEAQRLIEQAAADGFADAAEFQKKSFLFPLAVSNYIKGFCHEQGWYVYLRLSIEGQLFPLVLIGNKKIIIASEKQDITPLKNALGLLKTFLNSLLVSTKPQEIAVIPAVLTVKEIPVIDTAKTSAECEKNNIKIFDACSFIDFIEQLGNQGKIEQPLLDEMTKSVIGIVDSDDDIDLE
jgi:TPR repeat protein